ncbi:MAG TPA: hypothetical protein VM287_08210 [Egibacteraceae bacterium]|nr:hypothetical protein [Egibacteraceae bacterium]
MSPRDLGHAKVRFDADDRAAALDEEPCDDPGSTAHINDGAGAIGEEIVE